MKSGAAGGNYWLAQTYPSNSNRQSLGFILSNNTLLHCRFAIQYPIKL
jgi:hypothetical protein